MLHWAQMPLGTVPGRGNVNESACLFETSAGRPSWNRGDRIASSINVRTRLGQVSGMNRMWEKDGKGKAVQQLTSLRGGGGGGPKRASDEEVSKEQHPSFSRYRPCTDRVLLYAAALHSASWEYTSRAYIWTTRPTEYLSANQDSSRVRKSLQ